MKSICSNILSILVFGGIVALGAGCSPKSKSSGVAASPQTPARGSQKLTCEEWVEYFSRIQETRLSELLYEISQAAQTESGADEQQTDRLIQCLDQAFLVECSVNEICYLKKR